MNQANEIRIPKVDTGATYEMFFSQPMSAMAPDGYVKKRVKTLGPLPSCWRCADSGLPIHDLVSSSRLLGCVRIAEMRTQ